MRHLIFANPFHAVCFNTELLAPGSGSPPPGEGTPPPGGGTPAPGAGGDKPWFEPFKLPEPMVEFMKSKGFDKNDVGPTNLIQSAFNANRLISGAKDVVAIPGEKATPEDLEKFYVTLGRPEKMDGYKFEYPQGVKADPTFEAFARDTFFGEGVTQKQATGIVGRWEKFVAEANSKAATANTEKLTALKTQWGPDWDANVAAGQEVVRKLGLPKPLLASVEASLAGGGAELLQLMAHMGKFLPKEANFEQGGGGGSPTPVEKMTPEQARAQITLLDADAEFQAKYLAGEPASVKKMLALHEAANKKA